MEHDHYLRPRTMPKGITTNFALSHLWLWATWIIILLLATVLRLPFPDWDAGIAAHPDERYVLDVAHKVTLWGDPCEVAPDFPYGHLPIYIARLLIMTAPDADPLYVARLLAGLVSVLLVALAGAWGKALARRASVGDLAQRSMSPFIVRHRSPDRGAVRHRSPDRGTVRHRSLDQGVVRHRSPDQGVVRHRSPDRGAALVAALVLALAPFPIQLARFYTVDLWGAVLASASGLLIMHRRWSWASVLLGLALACKASLIWCVVPLAYALLTAPGLSGSKQTQAESPDPDRKRRRLQRAIAMAWHTIRRRARTLRLYFGTALVGIALVGIVLVTFFVASPWSFLRPVACWQGPLIQASLVSGRFIFPYTRQYARTLPYLYPLAQMALWGLGPMATLLGVLGLGQALVRWYRERITNSNMPPTLRATRVAVVWTLAYALVMGGLYVKFPRYLLPLYPTWAAWATISVIPFATRPPASPPTRCMEDLKTTAQDMQATSPPVGGIEGGRALVWLALLLLTLPLGIAQATVYRQPHPWTEASRWLYTHGLPGETIAVEQWDHPLPVPLPEGDPDRYTQVSLPVFAAASADSAAALAHLDVALQDADMIILASRRGYGAIARQPWPKVQAWYRQLLLDRDVKAFARCPRIGPLALTDAPLADAELPVPISLAARCGTPYALRLPRLDESFRVYDAPTVWVLEKK